MGGFLQADAVVKRLARAISDMRIETCVDLIVLYPIAPKSNDTVSLFKTCVFEVLLYIHSSSLSMADGENWGHQSAKDILDVTNRSGEVVQAAIIAATTRTTTME